MLAMVELEPHRPLPEGQLLTLAAVAAENERIQEELLVLVVLAGAVLAARQERVQQAQQIPAAAAAAPAEAAIRTAQVAAPAS